MYLLDHPQHLKNNEFKVMPQGSVRHEAPTATAGANHITGSRCPLLLRVVLVGRATLLADRLFKSPPPLPLLPVLPLSIPTARVFKMGDHATTNPPNESAFAEKGKGKAEPTQDQMMESESESESEPELVRLRILSTLPSAKAATLT